MITWEPIATAPKDKVILMRFILYWVNKGTKFYEYDIVQWRDGFDVKNWITMRGTNVASNITPDAWTELE